MNIYFFTQLHKEGFISNETLTNIKRSEETRPVSLHRELKSLMYIGVSLLTAGLGIIVYKNLDSISHLAIVVFIAIAALLCFAYCIKKSPQFSFQKAPSAGLLPDYILLLGCLLLLILLAYLQFQYQVFGNRWGMATFIPMILLFISAYYFDHLGVLSMAIVNLAAWAGITVTPVRLLRDNDFSSSQIIFTGFALGILLIAMGFLSVKQNIKAHFQFTYKNFRTHILFISSLAAVIHFQNWYAVWFFVFAGVTFFQFRNAVKERSFYFLVITTLYFYAGISYVIMRMLFSSPTVESLEPLLYVAFLYFITSGVGLAVFLIRYNKILKNHDSL